VPRGNGTDVPEVYILEIMGFPLKPGANELVAAKNGEEGVKKGEEWFLVAKNKVGRGCVIRQALIRPLATFSHARARAKGRILAFSRLFLQMGEGAQRADEGDDRLRWLRGVASVFDLSECLTPTSVIPSKDGNQLSSK
jgi:hypothetical protein